MIETQEIDALMESTAVVVREYFTAEREKITAAMKAMESRILDDLARRLNEIPAGPSGKDADPEAVRSLVSTEVGKAVAALPAPKDGVDGPPGVVDVGLVHALITAEVGKSVSSWPVPEDGKDAPPVDIAAIVAEVVARVPTPKDGKDGRDASSEHIREAVVAEVKRAISEIPKPKDGVDGRPGADFDLAEMRRQITVEVQCAISALPQPKNGEQGVPGKDGHDGESVHPDTISLMVVTEVAKAIALIPKAKDGEPGRNALQIEVLSSIDPSKSYPRGTQAIYQGGEIRASRNTSPIVDGLEKSGWEVIRDGEANFEVTRSADLRTFTFKRTLTSGKIFESTFKQAVILHRGVFKNGDEYFAGDGVISDNSTWICVAESTKAKPGLSPDWQLSARKGGDGKNGKDGKDGERGPEGPRGKDLTQMDFSGRKY